MKKEKFKITIIAIYREGEAPDPASLLDTFEDESRELLEPYGEKLLNHLVTVERVDA